MNTPSALDMQFNPRLAVKDADGALAERQRLSRAAADKIAVARKAYGSGPREFYLVTGSAPRSGQSVPAVVFIHGGYWRSGEAEDNLVLAPAIESLGARAIFLGYPLCPQTPLSGVIAAARNGVNAILEGANELGIGGSDVVLAGTSAGAHLAATLLTDAAIRRHVRGALLLTGIYDLTPVPLLAINAEIGIGQDDVRDHSPLFKQYPAVRSVFAVGGLEPPMWRAQSLAMAALARASGAATTVVDVPGRHHFDLLMEICEPASALRNALDDLLHGGR